MGSSLESDTVDIDVSRATRWLIASAVVVFVCGILAIVLPLTFSLGVAGFLGWPFYLRGRCSPCLWSSSRKRHPCLAGVHSRVVRLGRNQSTGESATRSGPSRLGNWRRSRCRRYHRDRSLFLAPRISSRRLDSDRRISHSGARDRGMRTLAIRQLGVGSIPCGNQFHFERHFPFVAGLGNSRHGANRNSGWMNTKQSHPANSRVFACLCWTTNSRRRVRACANAEGSDKRLPSRQDAQNVPRPGQFRKLR